MKKLALFTFGLLVTSAAFAQQPGPGKAGAGNGDRRAELFAASDINHDGKLSQAEWQQAQVRELSKRFEKLDINHDGLLTQEEMREARKEQREMRAERKDMVRARRDQIKALDSNGDKQLSRAEIGDKMPRLTENFTIIDLNNDGQLSKDELAAARRAMKSQAN
jgi:Ca2+-binding EF-hand superfamily protein